MRDHLTERDLIEYRFRLNSDTQVSRAAEHLSGCAECRERLQQLNRKFAALDLLREDIEASEELISRVVEQAKRPAKPVMAPFSRCRWVGVAAAAMLVVGLTLLVGSLTEKRLTPPESVKGPVAADRASPRQSESLPKVEEESTVLMVAKKLDDEADVALGETWAMRRAATGRPAIRSVTDSLDAGKDLYSGVTGRVADEAVPTAPSFARKRDEAIERGDVSAAMKPAEEPASDQRLPRSDIRLSEVRGYGGQVAERSAGTSVGRVTEEQISEQAPFAPASAIELVVLPKRDSVQITIYNSADLTLVRERRNLTLKRGWNWLQFMWANTLIDPTSLSLEPVQEADKIDVQQLVFPARLRELGRWLIRSEVSGRVPFEITYFTSGLSWRAFYMGTLSQDEETMRLDGYVRVGNNSGEDYENAQTRLIVGKVHILDEIANLARRQYPYGRPGVIPVDRAGTWEARARSRAVKYELAEELAPMVAPPKEIKKEGLSEYFLYTIEGTDTISTGWSKRLLSFDVDEVPVVNLYKYEEERYGRNVVRFLSFKNDEEHKLGETPIPGGLLKVYRTADEVGHLSYTGQSSFKYIPVDEDVELNLGPVANMVVEPKLMDYKTANYRFDRNRNVAGWDEIRTFKVEVKNTRDIGVKVEIQRNFETPYWTLKESGDFDKFEKVDLDTVKFTLRLEPRSARKFEYILATYHGVRAEEATRQLRLRD